MYEHLLREDADVVSGWRKHRRDQGRPRLQPAQVGAVLLQHPGRLHQPCRTDLTEIGYAKESIDRIEYPDRRIVCNHRDIHIAEPGATIGFAGERVIEQTVRETLPEGFQRSEYLLDHGMVDMVVPRKDLKRTLERSLRWFERGRDPERRTGTVSDDVLELPQTD